MKILDVSIHRFRNLKDVSFSAGPEINAFFGENAQGKSNFLEALFVAMRGESFRPYSVKKDWITLGGTFPPFIHISFLTHTGAKETIEFKDEGTGVKHYLNEKRSSSQQLRLRHPIVVFSPDDHQVIRGEPEFRRRVSDDILSDVVPGHYEQLLIYERALKSRNTLLKEIREKGFSPELKMQLQNWSALLAESGVKLLEIRDESWPEYKRLFQRVIHSLIHTQAQPVDIEWKSFPKLIHKEEFEQNLGKNLDRDIATGWTHYGPHREDFEMLLNGIPARTAASQGQARLLAMALRWAHAEWIRERCFEEPIFFVDDLSSELDKGHLKALFERLKTASGQVFLTSTNESFLEPNLIANTRKAYIVNGRVSERDFIG